MSKKSKWRKKKKRTEHLEAAKKSNEALFGTNSTLYKSSKLKLDPDSDGPASFTAMSRVEEKRPNNELAIRSGRLHSFMTVLPVHPDQDSVAIPHDFARDSLEEVVVPFNSAAILSTPNYVDMELFKAMRDYPHNKPYLAHPDHTLVERMATALEKYRERFPLKDSVALVMDTETYNDLMVEANGVEAAQYWSPSKQTGVGLFLGIPVISAPTTGDGGIHVVSPATHYVYVKDEQVTSTNKYKYAYAASSDAVVVKHDPDAHVVSKNFDEETGDWCVDCWTCGYSHYAWEEEDADELLKTHDSVNTSIFYRSVN